MISGSVLVESMDFEGILVRIWLLFGEYLGGTCDHSAEVAILNM